MLKSLLSSGKVKTRDAQTCVFACLKMILYRHRLQASIYYMNDGMDGGGLLWMLLSAPLITHGNL